MAFGDGFSALVGPWMPVARLPYNREKSWGGTLAFVAAGTAGAWFVCRAFGVEAPLPVLLLVIGAAAVVESLPVPLIDNISVPLFAAFASALLLPVGQFQWPPAGQVGVALFSTLCVGTAGWLLKLVSPSGWAGGIIVGTLIFAFASWQGFVTLLAFFILATAFTFVGYRKKKAMGIEQEGGGRRGAVHALANCFWGVCLAALVLSWPDAEGIRVLFAAAFATALSDTSGSEIGKAFGRLTFLPWNLRRVPPGTEGAVSLEGLAASLLMPFAIGGMLAWMGWISPLGAAVVGCAGFLGNLGESFLARLGKWNNELLNFANTILGSGLGMLLWNSAR